MSDIYKHPKMKVNNKNSNQNHINLNNNDLNNKRYLAPTIVSKEKRFSTYNKETIRAKSSNNTYIRTDRIIKESQISSVKNHCINCFHCSQINKVGRKILSSGITNEEELIFLIEKLKEKSESIEKKYNNIVSELFVKKKELKDLETKYKAKLEEVTNSYEVHFINLTSKLRFVLESYQQIRNKELESEKAKNLINDKSSKNLNEDSTTLELKTLLVNINKSSNCNTNTNNISKPFNIDNKSDIIIDDIGKELAQYGVLEDAEGFMFIEGNETLFELAQEFNIPKYLLFKQGNENKKNESNNEESNTNTNVNTTNTLTEDKLPNFCKLKLIKKQLERFPELDKFIKVTIERLLYEVACRNKVEEKTMTLIYNDLKNLENVEKTAKNYYLRYSKAKVY